MPCYGPTDREHIAYERQRGGGGLISSEMPAVLCAILRIAEEDGTMAELMDRIDWITAGVRRRDVEAWWVEHQARDARRKGRT